MLDSMRFVNLITTVYPHVIIGYALKLIYANIRAKFAQYWPNLIRQTEWKICTHFWCFNAESNQTECLKAPWQTLHGFSGCEVHVSFWFTESQQHQLLPKWLTSHLQEVCDNKFSQSDWLCTHLKCESICPSYDSLTCTFAFSRSFDQLHYNQPNTRSIKVETTVSLPFEKVEERCIRHT